MPAATTSEAGSRCECASLNVLSTPSNPAVNAAVAVDPCDAPCASASVIGVAAVNPMMSPAMPPASAAAAYEEVDVRAASLARDHVIRPLSRMDFSLLIEIQIASPTPEAERQAFHDAVEQATLADQLGYHCVWAVEHHGLYEYSHCSAPEVLLGFIAARTSRIRLGHAVTLTPHRYNHPMRVAERVAVLDILSGGRVNWGSGKSASRTEQGAYEIDREELDGQWREALEMIPRMWGSEIFEWDGVHYHVPRTPVIPKPVQRPHPPIHAACSRMESVVLAGSLGIGSLNFSAGTDEYLAQKVQAYRDAIVMARTSGRRITNRFACTPTALVLDDDREACMYGFRGARFFSEGLATYFFSPTRVVGELDVNREPLTRAELDDAMASRTRPGAQLVSVIGNPAAARESVARFAATGVDELILVMQMGTVPHEIVMRSLRTFAEQVMPHFT